MKRRNMCQVVLACFLMLILRLLHHLDRVCVLALIVGMSVGSPVAHAQGKCVKPTFSREPAEAIGAKERDEISCGRQLGLMVPIGSSAPPAVKERMVRPWWVALELGDGQLELTSDQFSTTRNPTFALGFVGGHSLGNRARLGLELNGWLLQSFNLNNPAVGESVSNVWVLADVFPIRKTPLFLRAGSGLALYQNNRPGGSNGTGWSWTAGVGYEIPLTEQFGLAPIVDYATGSLGDVRDTLTLETNRRYSVVEFKVAIAWHFGRTK